MRELLAYSKESILEEKFTLRIRADNNGDVYLPVAGYSPEGLQSCDYNWKVSIDGGEETEYNGVGSSNGKIRVGYGLSPLSGHTVSVKPIKDGYGWLRALGYKGTDIAGTLINIISDKSYKGYAVSEIFTGDWYKAYQYYGCVNLVNTDEELLPNTLQIIGDNYRYYEYAGCVKLVSNAEERILKTVKAIGDNYRAYQYQNCTAINNINMRAINWASVGENYRKNQYDGVGTDRNQVKIYIEGGIEEGGDWGLINNNVKGVYVFKDLVSDYQTKLSTITSSKIQKNPAWDNNEYEFIEFIALADSSGKVRIPIGGFSTTMSQDCAYDWLISLDGGEETEYTGTGDDTYFSIGSDLVEGSEHRVIIKPKTIGWGWGRAFGYLGTGAQAYIKELIHDSYKCFAVGRLDTGAHYKHGTFTGCINLINSYEKLPTSVTTIGDYYMKECYAGCTGLETAFWEVLHKDCTVGVDYRHHEYTGCTSLAVYQGMAGYTKGAYPTNYKYEYLAGAGDDMDVYITRKEILPSNVVLSYSTLVLRNQYTYNVSVAGKYKFSCMVHSDQTDFGHMYFYFYKNGEEVKSFDSGQGKPMDYNFRVEVDCVVGDVIKFECSESNIYGSGSGTDAVLTREYSRIGLDNNRINNIYCHINDVFNYRNSANWSGFDGKIKGWIYNYVCNEFIDINRYTKLLGYANLPAVSHTGWNSTAYNRGLGVNRRDNWDKFVIGITEYGDVGYGRVGVAQLNIDAKEENGERLLKTNSLTVKSTQSWGGTPNYSSSTVFADGVNYDVKDNIYGNYLYITAGDDYAGLYNIARWTNRFQPQTKKTYASAISKNGQYLFGSSGNYGWSLYYTDNPNDFSNYKEREVDNAEYGNLIFSDDGMTMVVGNEDWSTLTQYSLTSPRDVNTAVSTGKTLSINGQVSLSNDGRYLFVFNGFAVYQYTYE